MRIAMHVSSLANPFVEAWASMLLWVGSRVVILVAEPEPMADFPDNYREMVLARAEGESTDRYRVRVEDYLVGEPDVIYYWWGFYALRDGTPTELWPNAHVSLCVDTYPNASMLATEIREWAFAVRNARRIDSLVVTSPEMDRALRARFPQLKATKSKVVYSPFPLSSHARSCSYDSRSTPALCFTGRSDYLYRPTKRMAKDNVARALEDYISLGATVHVQAPIDAASRAELVERGYCLYEALPRSAILDGSFATFVGGFDAHIVTYSTPNGTLRRRVANSLSTRFAVGLCSPSPMIVPSDATFARRFFARQKIGTWATDAEAALRDVATHGDEMRMTWNERHSTWSGECAADELDKLWRQ